MKPLDSEDAELILTAFGGAARIVKTAIFMARKEGLKVGLIRPITVFSFSGRDLSHGNCKNTQGALR